MKYQPLSRSLKYHVRFNLESQMIPMWANGILCFTDPAVILCTIQVSGYSMHHTFVVVTSRTKHTVLVVTYVPYSSSGYFMHHTG
jgi:hypothetical protein